LTEEQEQSNIQKASDERNQMKKEFEVMNCSLKEMSDTIEYLGARLEKYEGTTKLLEKEVELESYFCSRTTTRELARRALVQSTAEANWKSLEEHPTILNIYQATKDRRNEQEQRIEGILQRFENIPTANEFLESLRTSDTIRDIKKELADFERTQEATIRTVRTDRVHANKHDIEQRDKIADIQTAMDTLEFLQSENMENINGAMIFLMGAFSEMGCTEVVNGLKFMLKKPYVEPEKDETEPF